MPENNLTPEQEAEVRRLHETFRQEFEEARSSVESSRAQALSDIDDLKDVALSAIKMGITQRDNKKLAVDTARWCYDHLIRQGKAGTDSLEELLRGAEEARAGRS